MPRITMANIAVAHRPDAVVIDIPVDGRRRTLIVDPLDAVQIANQIATAAVAIGTAKAKASMTVVDIGLKPFDSAGNANLLIVTAEHGPFVVTLSSGQIRALSKAADAALELAKPTGQA